nr:MAG TPA: hypothetical protein [Caudoviricetes sp.]
MFASISLMGLLRRRVKHTLLLDLHLLLRLLETLNVCFYLAYIRIIRIAT